MEIYLPVAISKAGTTLLIGDNFGSHFSPEVIEAMIQHNIKFITMPPNATHLCQPLDVAVFRGLKQSWRSILMKWRVESRIKGAIPKEHLPTLLNKLNNTLWPEALISGFRATGIYPMDKTEVIKRLPEKYKDPSGKDTVMILNESVLDILKNNLELGANPPAKRKPRGPKVEPGKRIHCLGKSMPSSSTELNNNTDSNWYCALCNKKWVELSNDVWIQCDNCSKPYHLQCCGLIYDKDYFYELNIENINFVCSMCESFEKLKDSDS